MEKIWFIHMWNGLAGTFQLKIIKWNEFVALACGCHLFENQAGKCVPKKWEKKEENKAIP